MMQRFFLLTALVGALASLSLRAQGSADGSRVTAPYQFPKVAVTDKVSVYEAWRQSQIPEDVLRRMTTEAVVKSCIKFPFMMEIYAANSQQYGFTYAREHFNGLQELFKRPDAAAVLLKVYQETGAEDVLKFRATPVEGGAYSFQLSFLEIILAQRDIIRQFDAKDLKTLASGCLAQYDGKLKVPEAYGRLSLTSTGFVMIRLLESQQKQIARANTNRSLLEDGITRDMQTLTDVYQATQLFVQGR